MILQPATLSITELRHLFGIKAETPQGRRLHDLVAMELFSRLYPEMKHRRGRDALLTWFASQDRIMSRDELRQALGSLRSLDGSAGTGKLMTLDNLKES